MLQIIQIAMQPEHTLEDLLVEEGQTKKLLVRIIP